MAPKPTKKGTKARTAESRRKAPTVKTKPKTQNSSATKKSLKALQRSELRYRRLFETAEDGILILDAKTGIIDDVNPFLIRMLGYSREELVQKKLWEVGAFEDETVSRDAFKQLQKTGYIRYEDLPLKAKDGHLIEVEFVSNVYSVGTELVIQCNIRDITEHNRAIMQIESLSRFPAENPNPVMRVSADGSLLYANTPSDSFLTMWGIQVGQILPEAITAEITKTYETGRLKEIELPCDDRIFSFVLAPVLDSGYVNLYGRDITWRKQAAVKLRQNEERFRSLYENSTIGMYRTTPDGQIVLANPALVNMLGYSSFEELRERNLEQTGFEPGYEREAFHAMMESTGIVTGLEAAWKRKDGTTVFVRESAKAIRGEAGSILYYEGTVEDVSQRKQAEDRTMQQLQRLTALKNIDLLITSNLDLRVSMETLTRQIMNHLKVDAVAVRMLNPVSQMLEFHTGQGFYNQNVKGQRLHLGDGFPGRVALERRMIHIENLKGEKDSIFTDFVTREDFTSYFGVPLIARGTIKGVLEIYHRSPFQAEPDWIDFLETLAQQTAIAVDNIELFEDLQRSQTELTLSYDATIEGWSRAMDLRDKETEDHTRRVTEMSIELAQMLNVEGSELLHIRWGALLHDIGKIGVPDNILRKIEPLTEEEWTVIRKHPQVAYELLSPIRYLRPAIDIPYCHHEKWDGSGYPRGLKEKEIPLAARLFCIVDVWDALTSDRPYRQAWTKEKTRQYIYESSGIFFDPRIAEMFLKSDITN